MGWCSGILLVYGSKRRRKRVLENLCWHHTAALSLSFSQVIGTERKKKKTPLMHAHVRSLGRSLSLLAFEWFFAHRSFFLLPSVRPPLSPARMGRVGCLSVRSSHATAREGTHGCLFAGRVAHTVRGSVVRSLAPAQKCRKERKVFPSWKRVVSRVPTSPPDTHGHLPSTCNTSLSSSLTVPIRHLSPPPSLAPFF